MKKKIAFSGERSGQTGVIRDSENVGWYRGKRTSRNCRERETTEVYISLQMM
jgi:hypothetical protein